MENNAEKWWLTHQPTIPETINNPQEVEDSSIDPEGTIGNPNTLELIKQIGWTKYREQLSKMSYTQIIRSQQPTTELVDGSEEAAWYRKNQIQQENIAELVIVNQEFPKLEDTEQAHFWRQGDKKIWMQGEYLPSDESLMTRIYLACPTKRVWEVFNGLCQKSHESGIARNIQVALNLENFQGESLAKTFEGNNIIIYIKGKANSGLMTKLAEILLEAKQQVEDWQMSEDALASNREETLRAFMIPLADQISFVEMPNGSSYHTTACGLIQQNFGLSHFGRSTPPPLSEYISRMEKWGSAVIDEARMPYRHANMPALVYSNERG